MHELHTKVSYMPAIYLNIAINTLTLPLQAWFLPESPHYLYAHRKMTEFQSALRKLSEFNTGNDDQIDLHALAETERDVVST